MSLDLGRKQKEILEYIKEEISHKGYPPSVREICQAVGLKSTSTVHGHLERLEQKGFLRRDPSKPRTIEILEEGFYRPEVNAEIVNIPILGKITAGQPILAFEEYDEFFPISIDYLQTKEETFMLKVKGDSMIEAGILDGDWIIVKKQNTANNGDYVAALLDDEATVKTFYKEKDHIRLQPENAHLSPILTKDVTILGKVIGLYRKM